MKRTLDWLPIALGLVFLLGLAYLMRQRAFTGKNDFVQLYTGAKLAGTPELYSRTANVLRINSTLGLTMEIMYIRPPFYAALLKPLAFLPYLAAYAVFSLATLLSILWFVLRFSKECFALPFLASMSIPILASLCNGQDTPFLVALLGASVLLTRENRDLSAGLVLSLCVIKFHLFLFLPILLITKKRWRILGGAAVGTAALTVFGALTTGPESLLAYVQALRDPWTNPNADAMPNLHGLVAVLHGDATWELALAALVLIAFVWMVRRTENYEFLFAASIVCGLLTSVHSGIADDILLLPAFVFAIGSCSSASLRAALVLILTPVPYFVALAGAPYSAFLSIALLMLLGLFVYSAKDSVPAGARSSQPQFEDALRPNAII
ncbi:MAG TPA: glycosyltransferase family 87 protein [Bryobacteraceae bacterium]|nr:glycosyltransferase family 87 protein [Bryobacteraceae bacterium]